MKRVTQDDIIAMNEAYLACGTYSGAAKATGWSASTVKKYIIDGYKSEQKVEAVWYDITCLTPEEEKEIKQLWGEMLV